MGKSFLTTLATCLALMPLGALAQDSADTTSPAPSDLSLGSTEPEIGETYVAEVFTDWELRCIRTEDGNDPCQLYQLLVDTEGNAVAEFNIFALPEGGEAVAGATIITPLETLLTAQLRLGVDAGQTKRYPYSFCTQIGCFARLGFTAAEVEEFKRGVAANVTIIAAGAPDQPVALAASLSGFTAGWNRISGAE